MINSNNVFEYGGYHFKPHRKFRKGEVNRPLEGDSRPWKIDAQFEMRNMSTDNTLAIRNYESGKVPWSHEAFYAASGDSDADIFIRVENGRQYVPCADELYRYELRKSN